MVSGLPIGTYKLEVHERGDIRDDESLACESTGAPYDPWGNYVGIEDSAFSNLGAVAFQSDGSDFELQLEPENLHLCGEYSAMARSLVISDVNNVMVACGVIGLYE